jgi:hypothetical protein
LLASVPITPGGDILVSMERWTDQLPPGIERRGDTADGAHFAIVDAWVRFVPNVLPRGMAEAKMHSI